MSVPVILVCGFLGAGKTTLLRRLLANNEGYRIAVVRNEYADEKLLFEIPLLVREDSDMTVMEFPNTCVCCSAKSAFIDAIHKLVKTERGGKPFDLVVVELSGLTDPLAVCDEFMSTADVEEDVAELRKVIAVVDGTGCCTSSEAQTLLARFMAAADLVLLNKSDRATPGQLTVIEDAVRDTNPSAQLIRTQFCEDPSIGALLDFANQLVSLPSEPRSESAAFEASHQAHAHRVSRKYIEGDFLVKPEALSELEGAIGRWLWNSLPDSIWRAKGLLKLADGGWAELQLCADALALTRLSDNALLDGHTRILIIGPDPPVDALVEILRSYT